MSDWRQAKKEAWDALLLTHATLTRKIDRALGSEKKLSIQVYELLATLERAEEGRMRMSDLAASLVFDASSLTRLVDRLEAQGYVRREAHPNDRRSVFCVITPAGRKARSETEGRYRELVQEHFGRHLDEDLAATVSGALGRVRQSGAA